LPYGPADAVDAENPQILILSLKSKKMAVYVIRMKSDRFGHFSKNAQNGRFRGVAEV